MRHSSFLEVISGHRFTALGDLPLGEHLWGYTEADDVCPTASNLDHLQLAFVMFDERSVLVLDERTGDSAWIARVANEEPLAIVRCPTHVDSVGRTSNCLEPHGMRARCAAATLEDDRQPWWFLQS